MIKRTLLSARVAGHAFAAVVLAACAVVPASAGELSPKLAPYADIEGAEKVSLRLLEAVKQAKSAKSGLGGALGEKGLNAPVTLEIVTWTLSDSLVDQIRATSGVTVTGTSTQFRRVMVTTSNPDAVEELAKLPGVQMIRTASRRGTHTGSVEGLADVAMGSGVGSEKYGLSGAGRMVGILSDSFATTSEVRTTSTRLIEESSRTQLIASVRPGVNYALVVQSNESGPFTLQFAATTPLLLPDEELGNPICETRLDLFGSTGSVTRTLTPIPDNPADPFRAASCAPATAASYRSFGFQVNAPGTVTFTLDALDSREFYLSLRDSCETMIGEQCAGPVQRQDPPRLINASNQLSGDLPEEVFILDDSVPGSDEGAGMAELVYDVAPKADIAFHTAFISEASFAEGILKLGGVLPAYTYQVEDGTFNGFLRSDVIVDDVYYFREPVYQTGIIGWAAEQVVERGIPYFSSAGNGGSMAIRSVYQDVRGGDEMALPPQGGDLHRWPNGTGFLRITVPPRESFFATLQWNQPFQSVAATLGGVPDGLIPIWSAKIDLDMYLTLTPDAAGLTETYGAIPFAEGRLSKETQGNDNFPRGDAYEEVRYFNDSTTVKTVYLAIDHWDGAKDQIPQMPAPLEFTVNFLQITDGVQVEGIDRNNPSTGGPTIFGHPTAKGVISVAAVNYYDTPNFDVNYTPTNEIDPEDFTARGGQMTIYFDENGLPVRRDQFEPEIAAPDGNNTTFFGGGDFDLDDDPNFFGTSAAAPNAAAVAALMLELNPNLNPAQIAAALVETAIDVKGFRAGPGVDDTTGAGLINAYAAFDYVAKNYGVGVGPAAPDEAVFSFAGADGWEFQAPAGFSAPLGETNGQAIVLRATSNSNSLGWWRSPEFIVASVVQPSLITIDGTSGAGSLYRAIYQVSSSVDQAMAPSFRFRASSRSFEQTSELIITSSGDGAIMPLPAANGDPGEIRGYRQFFNLPSAQSRFRLYFDMLGFNPADAANGAIALENVQIDAFSTDVLLASRREKLYLFAGGSADWTAGNGGPDMGRVDASLSSDGLTLGPVADASKVSFGFFSSPLATAPAVLERNRLYCARARVKADVPAVNRAMLPSFRIRMNDSSNQMAAVLNVSSTSVSSEIPSDLGYVDYRLYFETPDALVGNKVRLSIDYIYVPGVGDDPTQKITLQSLSLDSFFGPVSN